MGASAQIPVEAPSHRCQMALACREPAREPGRFRKLNETHMHLVLRNRQSIDELVRKVEELGPITVSD